MDALIKDIRIALPEEGYELTIEDCKYIKNNLPIIHSIINIPGNSEYITYAYKNKISSYSIRIIL
jgi:hypothetical protein